MHIVPRISAKFATLTVNAVLPGGGTADITGVDVAVLPLGVGPGAGTTWVASDWRPPVATILLVGPLAVVASPPSYALTIPAIGGDLWARVVDTPEIDTVYVARIVLE